MLCKFILSLVMYHSLNFASWPTNWPTKLEMLPGPLWEKPANPCPFQMPMRHHSNLWRSSVYVLVPAERADGPGEVPLERQCQQQSSQRPHVADRNTVSSPYLWVPHYWVNQLWIKNIKKKYFRKYKKQNVNWLQARNFLHSIWIVFRTVLIVFTLY